MNMLESNTHIM